MKQNTLIKKEKNIANAFNDSRDDGDDSVTKGYFRGYMEAFGISTNEKIQDLKSELKVDIKMFRDEFNEFKNEISSFKNEMYSFREEINSKFDKLIHSINAQTQELRNQNAELRMKTDAFETYLIGDEEDKQKINSRLNRLESKVLLA